MRVQITYTLTREITAAGDYKVSVQVDAAENISSKIFVWEGTTPLYPALPDDLSVYPEDEPMSPGGRYRLDNATVTVDDVHHADAEAQAFRERIARLAQEYQEQAGDFAGTEQTTVTYE